jgi:hypothetical protein
MKLLVAALLATSITFAYAQKSAKPLTPAPTTTPTATPAPAADELAALRHKVATAAVAQAISDAEIAEGAAQASRERADTLRHQAEQIIISTHDALGLDATYKWDFQQRDYVKQPATSTPTPTPAAGK